MRTVGEGGWTMVEVYVMGISAKEAAKEQKQEANMSR